MTKFWLGFMAACVFSIGALGMSPSLVDAEEVTDIELTKAQIEEMSELQRNALEKNKEIINKYVEYGVYSEEKGQKMISHLDKYYNNLEKNQFIPTCDWSEKHRKGHKEN